MTTKFKFIILFILISLNVFSGVKDSLKFKHFSIGIRTGKDLGAELNDPVFSKLIISVDPIKYFRMDFQYGNYKRMNDVVASGYGPSGSYTTTLQPIFKSTSLAIGGFGMYNFDKTRIYLGYRYGLSKYKDDEIYSQYTSTGSNPTLGTNNSKTKMHSLVIGGEHFLGKWFSFGAEFGFNKSKETYLGYEPGAKERISTAGYTDASVILRFYLL